MHATTGAAAPPPGGADDALVRWGEREPPPERRPLAVGPLRLELCGASLENVRYLDVELLRAAQVVVRDRDWGTVPARVTRSHVSVDDDRCLIDLEVCHRDGEVDFRWTGQVTVERHGLRARFDGEAWCEFQRNRIGWCLLHPLRLAGTPATLETPQGQRRDGEFPDRISPHQPFREIRTLSYRDRGDVAGPVEVAVELDGEVFETEDQRNWTDASYKTYGTPLEQPFPVTVRRGQRMSQQITLRVTPAGPRGEGPAEPAARAAAASSGDTGRPGDEHLRIDAPGARLPALGLTIGRALTQQERRRLDATGPAFLHAELHGDDPGWPARLSALVDEASRLGVPARVAVVAASPAALDAPLSAIRTHAALGLTVHPFDAATHVSTPELVERATGLLRGSGVALGGGTRAHFAELNRATALPLAALDEVGYSVAAEVHARDRGSVRETLLAQPHTVRDARRIAAGRPVVVGPVGFAPRFNAVATGPGRAGTDDDPGDALPGNVDPRQASVFGAAWTVGALAGLAAADAVVLFDAVGLRGIAQAADATTHPSFPAGAGEPFPLWAALAALAPLAAGRVRAAEAPSGLAALAVSGEAGELLFVANLRDTPVELTASLPAALTGGRWSLLAADPASPRGWSLDTTAVVTGGEHPSLSLPAPSVALLTTRPGPPVPAPD